MEEEKVIKLLEKVLESKLGDQNILGHREEDYRKFNEIHSNMENISKLVFKHDTALYSADGTNGVCRDVNTLKDKIKSFEDIMKDHTMAHWKFAGLIISACGLVATYIALFFK